MFISARLSYYIPCRSLNPTKICQRTMASYFAFTQGVSEVDWGIFAILLICQQKTQDRLNRNILHIPISRNSPALWQLNLNGVDLNDLCDHTARTTYFSQRLFFCRCVCLSARQNYSYAEVTIHAFLNDSFLPGYTFSCD